MNICKIDEYMYTPEPPVPAYYRIYQYIYVKSELPLAWSRHPEADSEDLSSLRPHTLVASGRMH